MIGWQEEGDLASRLRVYRSVDSLVEFYIPLNNPGTEGELTTHPDEGFVYHASYYDIIHQEIQHDTLLIVGLAKKKNSFWQGDLLDFIKHQFGDDSTNAPQKTNHLLKLLVKEYYQGVRLVVQFNHSSWREPVSIPGFAAPLSTLFLPVHSPPPEV